DSLHSAGRTLGTARRRVGQDRHRTPAHGLRLVQGRDDTSGGERIAHHVVRAVVAYHVHVEGGDPAFLGESNLHPAVQTGTPAADVILFLAGNAHHDRSAGFFREERGNHQRDVPSYLTAKS